MSADWQRLANWRFFGQIPDMYLRDWLMFLEQGRGKEIAVAQLSRAITRHLVAANHFVYLHHDYAVKAVAKHGIEPGQFNLIFDTIERGIPLADRALHITFLWQSSVGWFQVTVKRAFHSRRVYICTFYKTNQNEAARKLRKYPRFDQIK
ncbi:MAG: hypothetical protein KIS90_03270 [Phenylobacterium sp.]|nr:hypothetical protein [Phenylobacterium sp.]